MGQLFASKPIASEITKNRGIAICAPIAPYANTRREVREAIEVHVAIPREVCEQRDRKGLYAKARARLIKDFTGINDPYEAPQRAEVTIDTTRTTADAAANAVLRHLEEEGYLNRDRV